MFEYDGWALISAFIWQGNYLADLASMTNVDVWMREVISCTKYVFLIYIGRRVYMMMFNARLQAGHAATLALYALISSQSSSRRPVSTSI